MKRWWWVAGVAVLGVVAAALVVGPGGDTTPGEPGRGDAAVPSEQDQQKLQKPNPVAEPVRPAQSPTVARFAQELGLDDETQRAVDIAVREHQARVILLQAELLQADAAPAEVLSGLRDQLGESFEQLKAEVGDVLAPEEMQAFMESVGDALEPSRNPEGSDR